MWDEYGPVALPGIKSARGLIPGPSCMHTDGHPRYEGTLSVKFESHDEWFYDPPCYGDLGQSKHGPMRSARPLDLTRSRCELLRLLHCKHYMGSHVIKGGPCAGMRSGPSSGSRLLTALSTTRTLADARTHMMPMAGRLPFGY